VFTWSYVLEKFAKIRYFNYNRCGIMEGIRPLINKNIIIFLDFVKFVVFVTFFFQFAICFDSFLILYKYSLSYLILYFFP
jgi:hypothetical protein